MQVGCIFKAIQQNMEYGMVDVWYKVASLQLLWCTS